MSLPPRDRLPPGQHLVRGFPVLSVGGPPAFDPETWDLRVFGEVEEERAWGWEALRALPRRVVTTDFHCVTTWSNYDNAWIGVRFVDLWAELRVRDRASHVMAHCDGGYSTNLPLADLLRDDVMLAWGRNGADLEPEHGFPLRLVVPHLYAWKSAKWLRGLEVMAADRPGYWELRGYHLRGDPWAEERFDTD